MSKRPAYHHGDLRNALLDAGEAELAESGLAGFSLRRVAARVGVSHAAPAHHFGDIAGLIDALAVRGFARLLACMETRQQAAPDDPSERLLASGFGYLDFAMERPALFRLVFGTPMQEGASEELQLAAARAHAHLAEAVAALYRAAPPAEPWLATQVLRHWTQTHGFAELLLAGHVTLPGAPEEARSAREALLRDLFHLDTPGPAPHRA